MALPYCSRIFAYSTARPRAPRDADQVCGGDHRVPARTSARRSSVSCRDGCAGDGPAGQIGSAADPAAAPLVLVELQCATYRGVDRDRQRRCVAGRSVRAAHEVVGEHRPEERRVDQAAAELLGHDGDLDPGRLVGAQRTPTGRPDLPLQPGDRGSSSSSRRPNRDRDHRPVWRPHPAAAVVHWSDVHPWRSFSTRRNTLPEGRRGISATKTMRLGRLYDASRSPTRAMSSSASTGAVRALQRRPPQSRRRRGRERRTPHSPSRPGDRATRPRSRLAPPGNRGP